MAIQDRNTIRNWFLRGLKPTQAQFWDTWDSFWHKLDKISIDAIEGLSKILNNKAEVSQLDAHINNTNNPHKIKLEQIEGAQEALESKANKDHKHSIEEIPGLREGLDAIGSGENIATANLIQTDLHREYSIEDGGLAFRHNKSRAEILIDNDEILLERAAGDNSADSSRISLSDGNIELANYNQGKVIYKPGSADDSGYYFMPDNSLSGHMPYSKVFFKSPGESYDWFTSDKVLCTDFNSQVVFLNYEDLFRRMTDKRNNQTLIHQSFPDRLHFGEAENNHHYFEGIVDAELNVTLGSFNWGNMDSPLYFFLDIIECKGRIIFTDENGELVPTSGAIDSPGKWGITIKHMLVYRHEFRVNIAKYE